MRQRIDSGVDISQPRGGLHALRNQILIQQSCEPGIGRRPHGSSTDDLLLSTREDKVSIVVGGGGDGHIGNIPGVIVWYAGAGLQEGLGNTILAPPPVEDGEPSSALSFQAVSGIYESADSPVLYWWTPVVAASFDELGSSDAGKFRNAGGGVHRQPRILAIAAVRSTVVSGGGNKVIPWALPCCAQACMALKSEDGVSVRRRRSWWKSRAPDSDRSHTGAKCSRPRNKQK